MEMEFIKKVDTMGRVQVPFDARIMLGLEPGDEVTVSVEADKVTIRKRRQSCIFCGNDESLFSYMDKQVCGSCHKRLMDNKPGQGE